MEKVENGGRLGPLGQNLSPPKPIRWIRPWILPMQSMSDDNIHTYISRGPITMPCR